MENIESIILPDLNAKPKRKKKESKTVLVEKETLPRVNRTVVCNYCDEEKILSPDQYQDLFESFQSEGKLKDEFSCKSCEMAAKDNPFAFWTVHGEQFQAVARRLKEIFDRYHASRHAEPDAVAMQTASVDLLKTVHIREPNFEFVIENRLPVAMRIRNVPFVGSVLLKVYESRRKHRIFIEG